MYLVLRKILLRKLFMHDSNNAKSLLIFQAPWGHLQAVVNAARNSVVFAVEVKDSTY